MASRASPSRALFEACSSLSLKQPISRGRNRPTFDVWKRFIHVTEEESKLLGQTKCDELEKLIEEMVASLSKTKSASDRTLLIQRLAIANEQRRNLGTSVIIEAIRNTAASKEFRAYNFDSELVSIKPEDYLSK